MTSPNEKWSTFSQITWFPIYYSKRYQSLLYLRYIFASRARSLLPATVNVQILHCVDLVLWGYLSIINSTFLGAGVASSPISVLYAILLNVVGDPANHPHP